MKVATWNVNGVRARSDQILNWLGSDRPDVVCLQEIKCSPAQVPGALCELEDYWTYWHGAKGYSGVGLLVRKDFSPERPEFAHPAFDFESRIVTSRIQDIVITSVYVPNGGKDFPAKIRFLSALESLAAAFHAAGDAFLICGDLNIARAEMDVHPKERRACIGQLPEERAWFENLLRIGLVDLGRELDRENDALFTWWAPWRQMRQRNIGWRLDYVLASMGLARKCHACSVQQEVGTSDHGPVTAKFTL